MIGNWILGLYYARLRRLDIEILWPEMLKKSGNIDWAKMAFAAHALHDPAWMFLGEDKIYEIIGELDAPATPN